jgi:aromatic-ring opening dioxygenase LigAB LigA subunit
VAIVGQRAYDNAVTLEQTVAIFAVNYLCREVLRDHAFRAAMKADPAKALAPLDLTDDERRALIAGDVGALYRMGVNGFLMGYLARFEVCGLNIEIYNERMRAVKVDEIGQPVG